MNITFVYVADEELEALAAFIASDTWPYNLQPQPSKAEVTRWLADGAYTGNVWIKVDGVKVGVLHYEDSSLTAAEVHIRLLATQRGKGIGKKAIDWLTVYLFEKYPQKRRIEGWTRVDNIPMRRVFVRCGYVKEAHFRNDFRKPDGTYVDKIGYTILHDDWSTGHTTPVDWHDE